MPPPILTLMWPMLSGVVVEALQGFLFVLLPPPPIPRSSPSVILDRLLRWPTIGENGSEPLSDAVAPPPPPPPINFSISVSVWSDRAPADVESTEVDPQPPPPVVVSPERFKMDFFRSGLARPRLSRNITIKIDSNKSIFKKTKTKTKNKSLLYFV